VNGTDIKNAIISRLKSEDRLLTDAHIVSELESLDERDIRHIEITNALPKEPSPIS